MDDLKKALREAIASNKMEGFSFDENKEKLCADILSGKVSYSKFLADCKSGSYHRQGC